MFAAIEKERLSREKEMADFCPPSPSSSITSAAATSRNDVRVRKPSNYTPASKQKVIVARPYRPSTAERNAASANSDTKNEGTVTGMTKAQRDELRKRLSNSAVKKGAATPIPPCSALPNFVKDAHSVTSINLRGRNLAADKNAEGASPANVLARMMLSVPFPQLSFVNLRSCNLGPDGIEALTTAICTEGGNFPSLNAGNIDLRANFLGDEGVRHAVLLCDFLQLVRPNTKN